MTPPTASTLPLPARPASTGFRGEDAASLVAERLQTRRHRTRAIRRWAIAVALSLFIALQVVIFRSTSSNSSSRTSSNSTGSASNSNPASSQSSGSGSTLVTSQS